jgi:hypothetical protein
MVAVFLRLAKDDLGLKTPGVYSIARECGKVHTGCSIDIRIKKHHQYTRLYHPEKSAVADHSTVSSFLAKKYTTYESIIREAIDLVLHYDNVNREG